MKWNRVFSLFPVILSAYLFTCCSSPPDRFVSEKMRATALDKLQHTLYHGSEREKVHAAELLVSLGYTDGIYDFFQKEEKQKGGIVDRRIGIWQVLAQTSPGEAEHLQWVDSISDVFKRMSAADHVRAAESLAKLKVSPYSVHTVKTDSILNGVHNSLWLYTFWGSAYDKAENIHAIKGRLADIVSVREESDTIRKLAAYALLNMGGIAFDKWELLIDAAENEPDSSVAYPCILGSVLINAPPDSLMAPRVVNCREKLVELFSSPEVTGHFEVLSILGEIVTEKDLPWLNVLTGRTSGLVSRSEDLAIAASTAILRIDRRQRYHIHAFDWGVIVLYGLAMLSIGWYYSRKTKNTEDYLLGGRKMNPIANGISLFATMISSLSYLSYPGEMIRNGPAVFIGMLIFPLVYYLVGWFLIPKFMEMKVTSAYELLEKKLGLSVRMLATFFFLTLRFFWMATIIYATVNIAFSTIVDIPPSSASYVGILLMAVTITYTLMGGFKAVVVSDVVQSLILWGGAIMAIIFVCYDFHSLSWFPDHSLNQWGSLKWGINAQERSTVGNAMIYYLVWFICTNGSDQMAIQRYLSTRDLKAARHTFGVSLISTFVVKIFLAVVGLAMVAYFVKNPHYLNDGQTLVEQADQLFPKFILVGLPVGISGLVTAGILAAAMSSLSSGLNSSASVIHEDILKRVVPNFKSANPLLMVKKISFFVGIVAILLSLLIGNVHGNLLDVIIKVVNLFVAPLFVLFFMAIFVPFATSIGTIAGGIFSVGVAVAIAFGEFLDIKVLWIMPAALFAGVVVGTVVSFACSLRISKPRI